MAMVNMKLMPPSLLQSTLMVVMGLLAMFIFKLYRVRSFFQRLRKQGLVRPKLLLVG